MLLGLLLMKDTEDHAQYLRNKTCCDRHVTHTGIHTLIEDQVECGINSVNIMVFIIHLGQYGNHFQFLLTLDKNK